MRGEITVNDIYRDFQDLATHECRNVDYCIRTRRVDVTLILSPHAGGIEPGTSELAEAIAVGEHSLYLFEGLKAQGNRVLHITSSRFDEPACLALLAEADRVLAVHGEDSEEAVIFIGGLDDQGIAQVSASLAASKFNVQSSEQEHLAGHSKSNVCNRGRTGAGVQLEISKGQRQAFFRALTPRTGRQTTTPLFDEFVAAVRRALV
jgi:phage replication-related protein YjqB (UPF0714/DUF867 family)